MNSTNRIPSPGNTVRIDYLYNQPVASSDFNEVQISNALGITKSCNIKWEMKGQDQIRITASDVDYLSVSSSDANDVVAFRSHFIPNSNLIVKCKSTSDNYQYALNVYCRQVELNSESTIYLNGVRQVENSASSIISGADVALPQNTIKDPYLDEELSTRIVTEITYVLVPLPQSVQITLDSWTLVPIKNNIIDLFNYRNGIVTTDSVESLTFDYAIKNENSLTLLPTDVELINRTALSFHDYSVWVKLANESQWQTTGEFLNAPVDSQRIIIGRFIGAGITSIEGYDCQNRSGVIITKFDQIAKGSSLYSRAHSDVYLLYDGGIAYKDQIYYAPAFFSKTSDGDFVSDPENGNYLLSATPDLTLYFREVGGQITSSVGSNNDLSGDVATQVVEGNDSTVNNHLEGSNNKVVKAHDDYANANNHLEGKDNIAGGYAGHVENSSNQTYETNAHAGGKHSVSSGSGSMSQGHGVITFGTAAVATGQSAFGDDTNDTTVLGVDGTDTAIDWTVQPGETEVQRAQRIANRLIGLWHGTEKISGSDTPNETVKMQFIAAIGSGAMAGGVNTFVNGGSSLGHGFKCEVTAQFGVATGHLTKVLANGGFAHGYDTWSSGEYSTTFGLSNRNAAKNGFVIGANCASNANGENGFAGGQGSEVQAKNSFAFGLGCFAAAPQAFALGQNIVVGTQNQTAVGQFNDNNSKAFFAVGAGADSNNRKNAFEVFSTYAISWGDLLFSKSLRSAGAGNNANNTIVFGTDVSNTASADNSFTGGENSQSQAKNAFTFGKGCYAAAENSTAFGEGIVVGTKGQFAVGKFNDNSSTALFVVGNGISSARKNVFEVFENYIAINGNKIFNPISTNSEGVITDTLKIGSDAQITYDSNAGYSTLTITPRYGPADPTVFDFGSFINFKTSMGYIGSNNAPVIFSYTGIDSPQFKTKGQTKSVKLYDGQTRDEVTSLAEALGSASLFAKLEDVINKVSATPTTSITDDTLTLTDGSSTQLLKSEVGTLTLTFGGNYPTFADASYSCSFSFLSGATATVLNPPTGMNNTYYRTIFWKGDDCDTGVLVPKANMIYYVEMRNLGNTGDGTGSTDKSFIAADVKAYPYNRGE